MKVIELKSKCDLKDVMNNKYNEIKSPELPVVSDFDFNIPANKTPTIRSTIPPHIFANSPFIPEPVLSQEEIKEKRKLIIHIKNYLREFPSSLTEFKDIDYGSKTISQLNNYLDEIKLTVCHYNSGGLLLGVFQGSCDVLESAAPILNFDLSGLKYVASRDPGIINSVKEISLEYQNLNYIPPEKRLGLLMFQMCYALNSVNKTNKKIEEKLNKNVPNEINEKYIEI